MGRFRIRNASKADMTTLHLEPWGEDYWLRPGEEVVVVTTRPDIYSLDLHADGIQFWVEKDDEAWVERPSGERLGCGYQRPKAPP